MGVLSNNRILTIGYLPGINGISTSILNIYRNLDYSRFQYDFLLPEKFRHKPTQDIEELASMGANLYYMDYDRYTIPEESHSVLRELMLSIPNLKGVHVHDINMMSYPLYLADEMGFPIKVIQCHTARSKSMSDFGSGDLDFIKRLDLIRGDQFDRLACSDLSGMYDYCGLPFEIMPNGVDIERFTFNPVYRSVLRKQLGIPEHSPVIGSVANLNLLKNYPFAVRVFHQFLIIEPESHYIIVGSGPYEKDIKFYIEKHRLSDRVHLVGLQREVDIFYSAMDILLQPSFSEGLPNSLVEAQATGLPCLISDQISDMAILTPLVTSFSLSENDVSWAKRMRDILTSSKTRVSFNKEIKTAGYDIKDVVHRLMEIYSRRLDENNQ